MLYAMMLALLLHDMVIVVGTWQSYGPSESNKGSTSMGFFFLLSWNWFAAARSISLGEKEANRILRSFGFRRSNSSNMMVSGVSHDAVMERSLSFSWRTSRRWCYVAAIFVSKCGELLRCPVWSSGNRSSNSLPLGLWASLTLQKPSCMQKVSKSYHTLWGGSQSSPSSLWSLV